MNLSNKKLQYLYCVESNRLAECVLLQLNCSNKDAIMNQLQFDLWQEFSTKAVQVLNVTSARKRKLHLNIGQFFETFPKDVDISTVDNWDDVMGYFYDFFDEFRVCSEKEKDSSFQSQLNALIRAVIDTISGDLGVVNWFTAGDIKTMFEGDIPQYVKARFTNDAFANDENLLPF